MSLDPAGGFLSLIWLICTCVPAANGEIHLANIFMDNLLLSYPCVYTSDRHYIMARGD